MTLTDTGPLVAILDNSQSAHVACTMAMKKLPPGPLVTTWACYTEAMYLLEKSGGYPYQDALWQFRQSGKLVIHETSQEEADRMRILMRQYRDVPMDLADASIVAAADALSLRRVFTIDSHFYAYRLADGAAFEVIM